MITNGNILIVDDNTLLCWALKKIIGGNNIYVNAVHNGIDAISELTRSTYQTVFLDINLPDINGFNILKKIKYTSPSTKVIIMTSNDSESNRQWAEKEGAFSFITKPFNQAELKRILGELFATNG